MLKPQKDLPVYENNNTSGLRKQKSQWVNINEC